MTEVFPAILDRRARSPGDGDVAMVMGLSQPASLMSGDSYCVSQRSFAASRYMLAGDTGFRDFSPAPRAAI